MSSESISSTLSPITIEHRRGIGYIPPKDLKVNTEIVADVFDSGGNSGPNSLGMSSAFVRAGLGGPDFRVGVSVGNINAAVRTTGQEDTALEGYVQNAKEGMKNFKLPFGMSVPHMNLNVLREILEAKKGGLDVEALVNSQTPLYVGLTKVSRGLEPHIVKIQDVPPERVIDVLMWSVTIPGVAGLRLPRDKENILGEGKDTVFCDGGLSILSGIDVAVKKLKATHAVFYATSPYDEERANPVHKALFGSLMYPYNRGAFKQIYQTIDKQVKSRRDFEPGIFQYYDAQVYGVYPLVSTEIPTIFNDCGDKARRGFEVCKEMGANLLKELGFMPLPALETL